MSNISLTDLFLKSRLTYPTRSARPTFPLPDLPYPTYPLPDLPYPIYPSYMFGTTIISSDFITCFHHNLCVVRTTVPGEV